MSTKMTPSRTDVPSIILQITKKNSESFIAASEALKVSLADLTTHDDFEARPLHERLFIASQQCHHPLISQFLERVNSAGLNSKERKGATMLFYDGDKGCKLRSLFALLSEKDDKLLRRSGLVSLFRTVLTAISSVLQTPDHPVEKKAVIVEGKPCSERPLKKAKFTHGESTASKVPVDETEEGNSQVPSQSPSWDSSLATLRDEDDCHVRKDIKDIASFAADHLIQFSRNEATESLEGGAVDFATFGSWYNASGDSIVPWIELLRITKWRSSVKASKSKSESRESYGTAKTADTSTDDSSPGSLMPEEDHSRTLVSFDFNGSGSPTPLLINISEDNLYALQSLVNRTHLVQCNASEVCKLLLQAGSTRYGSNGKEYTILRKQDFERAIQSIIPDFIYSQFSPEEKKGFQESFDNFFSCFEEARAVLQEGEVDLQEFAVGFCFFCAGNKSSKLATGFDLLDSKHRGYLTEDQLLRYLQSYLSMLVGMSLLSPFQKNHRKNGLTSEKRKSMRSAIENGAKWTLGHFLRASGQTKNEYTFESFATWYSDGGYNIAPWLELLDLSKVLTLIADSSSPTPLPPLDTNRYQTTARRPRERDRVSSLRRHHLSRPGPPPEILFTFPLGNRRSLVVLKEDASYVRAVVDQLGLLTMKPDDLWAGLTRAVEKNRQPTTLAESATYINMETFVQCLQDICPRTSRKRPAPGVSLQYTSSSTEELLANFFQCFDIDQCDSVALDELMGGLTLLCGGKKSHKLAFAFSIFDTRPGVHGPNKKRGVVHSLSGEDLFLFLRSILIVTFSTCRQSLDLTDDMVGRCIADTANMICNDVMRHQWETKHLDRLDFDEFGQWYNDGGFERAPWLELLDLRKWVLIDDLARQHHSQQLQSATNPHSLSSVPSGDLSILPDPSIPPAPPDDAIDSNFFDAEAIMPMDSMDEMDLILMQPSTDKDDFQKLSKSFSYSPRQQFQTRQEREGNPLKFHLNTTDEHGGYVLSLSQARIRHFRHVLEASGLHQINSETACNHILANRTRSTITKTQFDSAIKSMLPSSGHDRHTARLISDIFSGIFSSFDRDGKGEACALEVACGFTVLCWGKKSDKLEFAFEVLDKNKRGKLSTKDMASYLQSFLSVLLSIAFSSVLDNDPTEDTVATMNGWRCDRTTPSLIRAAKAGADWASSLVFRDFERNKKQSPAMSFDDFADWYTAVGYSSIPWLELLDLQKWAMTSDSK